MGNSTSSSPAANNKNNKKNELSEQEEMLKQMIQELTPMTEELWDKYRDIYGGRIMDGIYSMADKIKKAGIKLVFVNSTAWGGGVDVILRQMVPFLMFLGLEVYWVVIIGDEEFFIITKNRHVATQGELLEEGQEKREEYFETEEEQLHCHQILKKNAGALKLIVDAKTFLSLEDQQVFLLSKFLPDPDVERLHISTEGVKEGSWLENYYTNLLDKAKAAITHNTQFALSLPTRKAKRLTMPPCIDIFSPANKDLSSEEMEEAERRLRDTVDSRGRPVFVDHLGRQIDSPQRFYIQVSRFDEAKNYKGLIRGHKLFNKMYPGEYSDIHLYLLGEAKGAKDDPQAAKHYEELVKEAGDDQTIHVFNWRDDLITNYLRSSEKCVIVFQVSLKEGFGLTVSEAGWKKKPVIAGDTGGIRDQIIPGVTGLLVNPRDPQAIAKAIRWMLTHPREAQKMGETLRKLVEEAFTLVPHVINQLSMVLAKFDHLESEKITPVMRLAEEQLALALNEAPRHKMLQRGTVLPDVEDNIQKFLKDTLHYFQRKYDGISEIFSESNVYIESALEPEASSIGTWDKRLEVYLRSFKGSLLEVISDPHRAEEVRDELADKLAWIVKLEKWYEVVENLRSAERNRQSSIRDPLIGLETEAKKISNIPFSREQIKQIKTLMQSVSEIGVRAKIIGENFDTYLEEKKKENVREIYKDRAGVNLRDIIQHVKDDFYTNFHDPVEKLLNTLVKAIGQRSELLVYLKETKEALKLKLKETIDKEMQSKLAQEIQLIEENLKLFKDLDERLKALVWICTGDGGYIGLAEVMKTYGTFDFSLLKALLEAIEEGKKDLDNGSSPIKRSLSYEKIEKLLTEIPLVGDWVDYHGYYKKLCRTLAGRELYRVYRFLERLLESISRSQRYLFYIDLKDLRESFEYGNNELIIRHDGCSDGLVTVELAKTLALFRNHIKIIGADVLMYFYRVTDIKDRHTVFDAFGELREGEGDLTNILEELAKQSQREDGKLSDIIHNDARLEVIKSLPDEVLEFEAKHKYISFEEHDIFKPLKQKADIIFIPNLLLYGHYFTLLSIEEARYWLGHSLKQGGLLILAENIGEFIFTHVTQRQGNKLVPCPRAGNEISLLRSGNIHYIISPELNQLFN
ncbi:MAG: glycosyltransferase, partial [Candidatus Omnitrophica bacterium]|nr:glycosyltransferase [Candidatus Omnitrophota bacterium]